MTDKEIKAKVVEIIGKHGTYPILNIETRRDGTIIGQFTYINESELRIQEHIEVTSVYGRPIFFSNIVDIKYLSEGELVDLFNKFKKIVSKYKFDLELNLEKIQEELKEMNLIV